MKTIIIFEGIASSGKTTIEKQLADRLPNVEMVPEADTLMPLIDNRDKDIAINHLSSMLTRLGNSNADTIIVDRFHLTHAFRTKADISEFQDVENRLGGLGRALVVLLALDPSSIQSRIEETMKYRGEGWSKGGQGAKTVEEKVEYYKKQQEQLRHFIARSNLPNITIDTTAKNWPRVVDLILDELGG